LRDAIAELLENSDMEWDRSNDERTGYEYQADAVMALLAEQPTIEVYVQSASEGTWAELGFGHGNEVSHRAIKAELGAGGGGRYALVRLGE